VDSRPAKTPRVEENPWDQGMAVVLPCPYEETPTGAWHAPQQWTEGMIETSRPQGDRARRDCFASLAMTRRLAVQTTAGCRAPTREHHQAQVEAAQRVSTWQESDKIEVQCISHIPFGSLKKKRRNHRSTQMHTDKTIFVKNSVKEG